MDIHLVDESDVPLSSSLAELLPRLAASVLEEAGLPPRTEAGLRLVTDREMAGFNRRFLGGEGPTDVLALPIEELAEGRSPDGSDAGGAPLNVGDVVIAPDFVRRQAAERGADQEAELALMVVHGMLHLLGWDHRTRGQARRMESRERRLLAQAGMTRP